MRRLPPSTSLRMSSERLLLARNALTGPHYVSADLFDEL